MEDRPSAIAGALRPVRLIVAAQLLGLAAVGVVFIVLVAGGQLTPQVKSPAGLLLALAAAAVASVPVLAIVRGTFVASARRWYATQSGAEISARDWALRYLPFVLVATCLAEGVGLFGLVVFLLTGSAFALAAPLLAIAILLVLFPSAGKLQSFVSNITGMHWDIHVDAP